MWARGGSDAAGVGPCAFHRGECAAFTQPDAIVEEGGAAEQQPVAHAQRRGGLAGLRGRHAAFAQPYWSSWRSLPGTCWLSACCRPKPAGDTPDALSSRHRLWLLRGRGTLARPSVGRPAPWRPAQPHTAISYMYPQEAPAAAASSRASNSSSAAQRGPPYPAALPALTSWHGRACATRRTRRRPPRAVRSSGSSTTAAS